MDADTRGNKKWATDNNKRHNLREVHEREYKVNSRAEQASKPEADEGYEIDDSYKFLKKKLEKEEKAKKGDQKAKIYEEEMAKCIPKAKGKHALWGLA